MCAFAAVPLDCWGTVLPVVERMFSTEESVQLSQDVKVIVVDFSFYYEGKLSFGFLEGE